MSKFFPLRLIPDKTKIDFMGIKQVNIIISIIAIMLSLACISIKSFNFGIDFTGGALIEARLDNKPVLENIHQALKDLKVGEIKVQDFDGNNIMIRIGNYDMDNSTLGTNIELVKAALVKNYSNNIEFRKTDFVGPQVGGELVKKGILAILLSFAAILIYVALRFEWQYGVGIIIALVHDTIVSLGIMSFTGLEFDLTSIAAILTIIGYSVNDSVVIYDRIRENFKKFKKISVSEIINLSINETLSRTTLTVLTTLISVVALILYGGPAIHSFSILAFCGILIGTYSSIYVSAPILINFGLAKK
ncbi:unnamed protein product, partial [Sphagnum jensenii]